MQYVHKLVLMASILCLGLSPALVMNHGGDEHGEHMGGPATAVVVAAASPPC